MLGDHIKQGHLDRLYKAGHIDRVQVIIAQAFRVRVCLFVCLVWLFFQAYHSIP